MSIREHRLARRLAQRALAEAIGVQVRDLSRWERGLAAPPPRVWTRLAAALDVPAGQLEREHTAFASRATPGEGYTTAVPGDETLVPRTQPPPAGRYRVADLFCGAGGLSYGFEQTGEYVTTAGIDLLPDRVRTFTANHPSAVGISGDLTTFRVDRFRELAGEVDVVVGGPPCQGFSSIRPFRALTEGDPRNSLVEHYVLWIGKLKPRWFVFENVVGLLTHQGGVRLQQLVEGLASAGYATSWRVVNAALYGVPQSRERVLVVGNRLGLDFRWPRPTHHHRHQSMAGARPEVVRATHDAPLAVTVAEAIGDLPAVAAGEQAHHYAAPPAHPFQVAMRRDSPGLTLHRATRHTPKMLEIIRHAGANIHALPPGLVKSGFSSCYSRLEADRPSTTITVNFVHPASNRCIHPSQDRALTIREGARLQSFPDRFVLHGTSSQIVKQIGNAVPPQLGEAIARAISSAEFRASLRSRPSR